MPVAVAAWHRQLAADANNRQVRKAMPVQQERVFYACFCPRSLNNLCAAPCPAETLSSLNTDLRQVLHAEFIVRLHAAIAQPFSPQSTGFRNLDNRQSISLRSDADRNLYAIPLGQSLPHLLNHVLSGAQLRQASSIHKGATKNCRCSCRGSSAHLLACSHCARNRVESDLHETWGHAYLQERRLA